MKKPELLMPAGSFEKMQYAFAYGADAVYAGAPQFSLRARENAFSEEQIHEGAAYAHKLGKKFYLTANIVAHNRKIQPFLNKIDDMIAAKPDALIMADPGLIDIVKEKHPEQEIHLSVQANAMNWPTVKFWQKMGVSRIILSRELSIDEIKEIKNHVPEMEIEVFVHGAICIAHSGRCLLSNFFNYRDANDGCCTNACRWQYKTYAEDELPNKNPALDAYTPIEGNYFIEETGRPGEFMQIDEDEHGTYIMNAKDLMAIEYLDELTRAGVDSFKAEGRTKSIYYLTVATRAYRQAIDDVMSGKPFNHELKNELTKIHSRGYTAGFLINRADHELQRYDEGTTNIFSQEFAGTVKAIEPNRILIVPRNRLMIGDQIEIMSPNRSSIHTRISSMITPEGEPVSAVHGGTNREVWIDVNHVFSANDEYIIASRVIQNSPTRDLESA